MAAVSTRELLAAPVVTRVVRTLPNAMHRFTDFFNLGPDSANVEDRSGHDCSWDVFENTRQLANFRAPGVGPGTRAPQSIGHVFARIPRLHEKLILLDEQIFRLRRLGSGPDQVDRSGQQYVLNQQRIISQRFKNAREFMISRVLRGGFAVLASGEEWVPVDLAGGTFDVDYQVPAGNKGQLDLTGAGARIAATWATLSTPIGTQLANINADFGNLHGRPLAHIWLNSFTFYTYVMNNTSLQAQSGTSQEIFLPGSYERSNYTGPEGQKDTGFTVRLRAVPWVTWHIYDAMLEVNGTLTKVIPDDYASFLPEPASDWIGGINGSEIVRENRMAHGDERFGMQAWTEATTQPSGFELLAVDNFIPALYVPKCVAYAKVANF